MLTTLSLLLTILSGWLLFGMHVDHALIHGVFLISLFIFLGSLIAEMRGNIERSTSAFQARNRNLDGPRLGFVRQLSNRRGREDDAAANSSETNPTESQS